MKHVPAFLLSLWLRQRTLAAVVLLGMAAATLADIATPVFAGRLVDAVGGGQHDAAWRALVVIAYSAASCSPCGSWRCGASCG